MGVNKNPEKTIFLAVHGNIQGVGYRVFVYEIAKKYNINGMVRNVSDGSVEILAIGNEKDLKQFIKNINISTNNMSVFNIEKFSNKNKIKHFFQSEAQNNDFIIEKTKILENN
ncbi:MAG: acylphosphatase [Candidatus Marsarchaeota archaeon]|jgi:acylphosphatase|nr:acylphosphatase [Candidatus Marsarchaeota archaeon]MCL5095011.1 acylphosphatase [Candidatus Marsarchaeota archaeon]